MPDISSGAGAAGQNISSSQFLNWLDGLPPTSSPDARILIERAKVEAKAGITQDQIEELQTQVTTLYRESLRDISSDHPKLSIPDLQIAQQFLTEVYHLVSAQPENLSEHEKDIVRQWTTLCLAYVIFSVTQFVNQILSLMNQSESKLARDLKKLAMEMAKVVAELIVQIAESQAGKLEADAAASLSKAIIEGVEAGITFGTLVSSNIVSARKLNDASATKFEQSFNAGKPEAHQITHQEALDYIKTKTIPSNDRKDALGFDHRYPANDQRSLEYKFQEVSKNSELTLQQTVEVRKDAKTTIESIQTGLGQAGKSIESIFDYVAAGQKAGLERKIGKDEGLKEMLQQLLQLIMKSIDTVNEMSQDTRKHIESNITSLEKFQDVQRQIWSKG